MNKNENINSIKRKDSGSNNNKFSLDMFKSKIKTQVPIKVKYQNNLLYTDDHISICCLNTDRSPTFHHQDSTPLSSFTNRTTISIHEVKKTNESLISPLSVNNNTKNLCGNELNDNKSIKRKDPKSPWIFSNRIYIEKCQENHETDLEINNFLMDLLQTERSHMKNTNAKVKLNENKANFFFQIDEKPKNSLKSKQNNLNNNITHDEIPSEKTSIESLHKIEDANSRTKNIYNNQKTKAQSNNTNKNENEEDSINSKAIFNNETDRLILVKRTKDSIHSQKEKMNKYIEEKINERFPFKIKKTNN